VLAAESPDSPHRTPRVLRGHRLIIILLLFLIRIILSITRCPNITDLHLSHFFIPEIDLLPSSHFFFDMAGENIGLCFLGGLCFDDHDLLGAWVVDPQIVGVLFLLEVLGH
jgi:hypothetical protein